MQIVVAAVAPHLEQLDQFTVASADSYRSSPDCLIASVRSFVVSFVAYVPTGECIMPIQSTSTSPELVPDSLTIEDAVQEVAPM